MKIKHLMLQITAKYQGNDLLLQGQMKKQQNFVPKGDVVAKTGEKTLCSIDKVDDTVANAKSHL